MSLVAAGMIGQGGSALASGPDATQFDRVQTAFDAVEQSTADMVQAARDLQEAVSGSEDSLVTGLNDLQQSIDDFERRLKLAGLGLGVATILGGTGGVMLQQHVARRRRERAEQGTARSTAPATAPKL